jgi:hypothetical protein
MTDHGTVSLAPLPRDPLLVVSYSTNMDAFSNGSVGLAPKPRDPLLVGNYLLAGTISRYIIPYPYAFPRGDLDAL